MGVPERRLPGTYSPAQPPTTAMFAVILPERMIISSFVDDGAREEGERDEKRKMERKKKKSERGKQRDRKRTEASTQENTSLKRRHRTSNAQEKVKVIRRFKRGHSELPGPGLFSLLRIIALVSLSKLSLVRFAGARS